MQDSLLREWLERDEPWIGKIYNEASDFVHLSFRHLFTSIHSTDDSEQIVTFAISGEDSSKGEASYYEICDAFFSVTKLTGRLLLNLLHARHGPNSLQ